MFLIRSFYYLRPTPYAEQTASGHSPPDFLTTFERHGFCRSNAHRHLCRGNRHSTVSRIDVCVHPAQVIVPPLIPIKPGHSQEELEHVIELRVRLTSVELPDGNRGPHSKEFGQTTENI